MEFKMEMSFNCYNSYEKILLSMLFSKVYRMNISEWFSLSILFIRRFLYKTMFLYNLSKVFNKIYLKCIFVKLYYVLHFLMFYVLFALMLTYNKYQKTRRFFKLDTHSRYYFYYNFCGTHQQSRAMCMVYKD